MSSPVYPDGDFCMEWVEPEPIWKGPGWPGPMIRRGMPTEM